MSDKSLIETIKTDRIKALNKLGLPGGMVSEYLSPEINIEFAKVMWEFTIDAHKGGVNGTLLKLQIDGLVGDSVDWIKEHPDDPNYFIVLMGNGLILLDKRKNRRQPNKSAHFNIEHRSRNYSTCDADLDVLEIDDYRQTRQRNDTVVFSKGCVDENGDVLVHMHGATLKITNKKTMFLDSVNNYLYISRVVLMARTLNVLILDVDMSSEAPLIPANRVCVKALGLRGGSLMMPFEINKDLSHPNTTQCAVELDDVISSYQI